MKKTLMLLAIAASMLMTTGCGAKKRVKSLEEELTRCRQKKAELSEADQAMHDQYFATADTQVD